MDEYSHSDRPAFAVSYWNLTIGHATGLLLPTGLVTAMLSYIGLSYLLEAILGYGGCEVAALPILVFRRRYVSYCLPVVMVDAAERGWTESQGLRRLVWIGVGAASLVTIALAFTRVAPATLSIVAFVVTAALVAVLVISTGERSCAT